ncbi:glycosyltransferase family 2 protein [Brevibacillus centrosporus]|uniref:glycosyltransferase family 2 protein n=1 Tax=Brevibacillus centrosporus TaxID=54910 RepID=UPI0039879A94
MKVDGLPNKNSKSPKPSLLPKDKYIPIRKKFYYSHAFALGWMLFSIWFSIPWVIDLGGLVSVPVALFVIVGLSYIPGYMNAFMVSSLLLDRQPALKVTHPAEEITILIACRNEENGIGETIRYISLQDYRGPINIIVIDNHSTDRTAEKALEAGSDYNVNVKVIEEAKPGKNFALNAAIPHVETKWMITLDADTLLHKSAVRYIVARMLSAPHDVCAVAGAVLVRNSRGRLLARTQEWDYFLGIASIKRLQGLFQGTLVAQGAFSIYKTEAVAQVGGWPDAIGEDIVLTWRFLGNGWKVYFEPLAVAFTEVPETFTHFFRQRSRWARGMIEALKVIKPWQQPLAYTKYLTGCNFVMPYIDIVYTFVWLPGLVLAFFGSYWIVGMTTLLVLPLTLLQNSVLYRYQRNVFRVLELRIRKNVLGFFAYVLFYQFIMSPVSVWGYFQEVFRAKRIWK